jgi:hypothetical protein
MAITVDQQLAKHLMNAREPIELCDSDGHLLGTFTPKPKVPEPDISDEEAVRRITDPNTKFYTVDKLKAKMREWSKQNP